MFVPPALYYYVNFHTIRLNLNRHSAVKSFGLPFLRDVEYKLFNYFTEARGFSGFEDDLNYSSNRVLLTDITDDELLEFYPNTINPITKERKQYIPARKALFQTYDIPLGRPLFENNLQNFMLMGSRESGKSYSVSGMIAHSFLTDGATRYDE